MAQQRKQTSGQRKHQNKASRYYELGVINAQKGKYDEAIKLFNEALKINIAYREKIYEIAFTLYSTGKFEGAVQLLNLTIELSPEYEGAYLLLGCINYFLRKYKEGIKAFNKLAQLIPQDPLAFSWLGACYLGLRKYDQASTAFNEVLRLNPQDANAYSGLGSAHRHQGKYEQAIKAFKTAIELNLLKFDVYYGLGASFQELGKFKEAIHAYERAVLINPKIPIAHLNLGISYYWEGEYKKAINAFERRAQLRPENKDVFYLLGFSYERLKMFEEAIKAFERGIQTDTTNGYMNYILGVVCVEARHFDKAIEPLEKSIKLEPKYSSDAFYRLGVAYGQLERHEEAVNCLENSLKLNHDPSTAYLLLGVSLVRIGEYGRATDAFQISKESLLGSNQELAAIPGGLHHCISGIIYWAEQMFEQARSNFAKASLLLGEGPFDSLARLSRVLEELIPIDAEFENLLSSSASLKELSSGITRLSQITASMSENWQQPELKDTFVFPFLEGKIICLKAVESAFARTDANSKALDRARAIFRDGGFIRWQISVDAIETFLYRYNKLYKLRKGQFPKADEEILLQDLRAASVLGGTLSRNAVIAELQNLNEKLLNLSGMLERTIVLMMGGGKPKQVQVLSQQEITEYEAYISGRKIKCPLSYVDDTLRKDKDKFILWIDGNTREVLVNRRPVEITPLPYTLLIYIAQNVGKWVPRAELYKAVWARDMDKKKERREIEKVQKLFSRHIYKYGGEVLKTFIKAENGGYAIKKELISCFIPRG